MTEADAKPPFERAVVLGAGAVGSFLGARLASVVPTTLVARRAHVEAVKKDGLRLTGELDETVRADHIDIDINIDIDIHSVEEMPEHGP